MSPIKRGAPTKGYEKRTIKLYARFEPYEVEELTRILRLTGDSKTEALRKGVSLYIESVKRRLREQEERI